MHSIMKYHQAIKINLFEKIEEKLISDDRPDTLKSDFKPETNVTEINEYGEPVDWEVEQFTDKDISQRKIALIEYHDYLKRYYGNEIIYRFQKNFYQLIKDLTVHEKLIIITHHLALCIKHKPSNNRKIALLKKTNTTKRTILNP